MPTPYVEDQQEADAAEERRRSLQKTPEQIAAIEASGGFYSEDPEERRRWRAEHGVTEYEGTPSGSIPDYNDPHMIDNPRQMRASTYDDMTGLYTNAPSADDLDVFYEGIGTDDEYGNLIGDGSQVSRQGQGEASQARVMAALKQLSDQGGYTRADRDMQNAMGAQNAQQVGAQNQAAMRGQFARGMGGSGAGLASQLSGSQGLASANAMGNAQIQQAAMQRLMDSYGMQGSLAGQQNSQQLQRQNALDAYNQRQLDWRRNRTNANVAMRNQSRESSSAARQQAWENKRSALADRTNQFIGGTGTGAAQRTDAGAAVARGINAGVSTLASFFG